MYRKSVDNGRITLGMLYLGLAPRDSVLFKHVKIRTGGQMLDAGAIMKASYADGLFSRQNEQVDISAYFGMARISSRFFHGTEKSPVRSFKRATIPAGIRNAAGIPEYGRVSVVKKGGYALISADDRIAGLKVCLLPCL